MKGTILLNHDENVLQVEDEEKARFLRTIIYQMFEDVPTMVSEIDKIWTVDGPLPVSQKIQMRQFMNTYHIQVIDDLDGHMKVFVENELVGEWFKSKYKLRRDVSQLNPKRQLFLEMEINFWSVFESSEENEHEIE